MALTFTKYPKKFNLSGNPIYVEVVSNTAGITENHRIVVRVVDGSSVLIGEESLPVINNQALFDISDYCKKPVTTLHDIFGLFDDAIVPVELSATYSIIIFETYNNLSTENNRNYGEAFKVINGGFSRIFYDNYKAQNQTFFDNFLSVDKRFLSWSPDKKLTWNQHDSLYFVNFNASKNLYADFTLYFNDDTSEVITTTPITASTVSTYRINPSYLAQLFDAYDSDDKYIISYTVQIFSDLSASDTPGHIGWIDTYTGYPKTYGYDTFNFNALPAGRKIMNTLGSDFIYTDIGKFCQFYTSTNGALAALFGWRDDFFVNNYASAPSWGLSVRLMRDLITGESALDDGTIIEDAYTDIDGNVYDGVKIGTQVWITKNLFVTKYANGSAILTDLDDTAWLADTTGAYCIYPYADIFDTEQEMVDAYGLLYNQYAVLNVNGLATAGADGWRVPSYTDYSTLKTNLGTLGAINTTNSGAHLKSTLLYEFSYGKLALTEIKTYYIDRKNYNYGKQFIFRNSLGAFDIIHLRGMSENVNELQRTTGFFQTADKTTYSEFNEAISVASGFIVDHYDDLAAAKRYIIEFFNSREIYEIVNKNIILCIPTSNKVKINKDGDFLFSFLFEYNYAATDNYFSPMDSEQYLNPRIFYRNGNIEEVAPGGIATVNFDVWINEDSTTTFTLNWGVDVGITYLTAIELLDSITSALESSITVPSNVLGPQVLVITDNHGGTYHIHYNVVNNQMLFNDNVEMLFNDDDQMLYN